MEIGDFEHDRRVRDHAVMLLINTRLDKLEEQQKEILTILRMSKFTVGAIKWLAGVALAGAALWTAWHGRV